MKLRPATKRDFRNTSASKKCDNDVVSANYDVINMSIFGWLEAIKKSDFRRMVYNYYTWIKETFYFKKRKTELKLFNTALTLLLWVKELILAKMLIWQKMMIGTKTYISWYYILHMCAYLRKNIKFLPYT